MAATERPFYVYGAGGHGKVVAEVGRSSGLALGGFIDDDVARQGRAFSDAEVLPWNEFLWRHQVGAGMTMPVALGIGDNAARSRVFHTLREAGIEVVTLVHASAVVAPTARLGAGTAVMAGAIVNPDAVTGFGCILNTACVMEHDVEIGDFVHLSPNCTLGGAVRVGAEAHVGLGAIVLPSMQVGANATVGAGAVVLHEVPDGETVAGVPARILEKRP